MKGWCQGREEKSRLLLCGAPILVFDTTALAEEKKKLARTRTADGGRKALAGKKDPPTRARKTAPMCLAIKKYQKGSKGKDQISTTKGYEMEAERLRHFRKKEAVRCPSAVRLPSPRVILLRGTRRGHRGDCE